MLTKVICPKGNQFAMLWNLKTCLRYQAQKSVSLSIVTSVYAQYTLAIAPNEHEVRCAVSLSSLVLKPFQNKEVSLFARLKSLGEGGERNSLRGEERDCVILEPSEHVTKKRDLVSPSE